MNYCTIEEAWGNQINNEKKKKKKSKSKRLYNSQIPKYIEDSSYEDGGHDYQCDNRNNRQYHNHVKKPRKGRKIKSSRKENYEVSYGDAQKEYDNYKNETKQIKKNDKRNKEKKAEREDLMSPSMFSGYSEDEQLSNYNNESDMNIEMEDNQNNQEVDYNRIQYDQESGIEDSDYLQTQDYNMEMIEGFENNGEDLDSHNIRDGNTKVKDVGNNKVDNLMDKLLKEKTNNASSDEEVASENEKKNETTDSELTTTDEEKEVVVNTKKNANIKVSKKDIDYRLNNLNRSMNMIIKQMNKSQFFDDESQDNIHDLILFILFGIFIIFILDSIYKLGKNSSPSIGY
jgi:hypothetical protein